MFGVVTRDADAITSGAFDRCFYEVKGVTGRTAEPRPDAVSMISCFADNQVEDRADLVPVDDEGNRATRDRPYFDWSYVCPTSDEYREMLLDAVDEAAGVGEDVRLDDVGFPRDEYCHCERCERRFAESDVEDREAWREGVITDFVAEARERVPGRLYVTLYPNPYPGHLSRRAGVDVAALAEHVDEFVVPLYDTAYGTTYWLEILARGFEDSLSIPFSIELYAPNVDVENLRHAAEVAEAYGDGVLFAYDPSAARGVLGLLRPGGGGDGNRDGGGGQSQIGDGDREQDGAP